MKTGCLKLRSIYAQLVQRRLRGRIGVVYFFFSENSTFSMLSSTFMRYVFTPIEFNISLVKYVFTTLTSLAENGQLSVAPRQFAQVKKGFLSLRLYLY